MKLLSMDFPLLFSKVLKALFILSSHLNLNTVSGNGVQYCVSPDNLMDSVSDCGPSGVYSVNSPKNSIEEESSTNRTLEIYVKTISTAFINIPNQLLQFSICSYSYACSAIPAVIGVLQSYFAMLANFLQSCFINQLSALVLPTLYGCLMVLFSWLLVYYDSTIPGVNPPTPVSPKKHRIRSGHTFHLGYTIGLLNGIIVFVLTLWQHIFY